MEQEVATALEERGFVVSTNVAFRDLEQDTSREIDVQATKVYLDSESHGVRVLGELVCECKNNSYPIVFIARQKSRLDKKPEPEEYVFPGEFQEEVRRTRPGVAETSYRTPFVRMKLRDSHYYYKTETKAVQFCMLKMKKKRLVAEHGAIYNSMFYPAVKAFLSRREEIESERASGWARSDVWLFFPVVVLQGPLYMVDVGAKEPTPKQVPYVSLLREIRTDSVNGCFLVDFVQRNSLDVYLSEAAESFATIVADEMDILASERAKGQGTPT
jgi:hypothetical protein